MKKFLLLFAGLVALSMEAHPTNATCQGDHGYSESMGQCAPSGGWFPYGGGLLTWWSNCCFPNCGAPDDYCRKPLPCTCWPPYSADYTWAPSEPWTANCSCASRAEPQVVSPPAPPKK